MSVKMTQQDRNEQLIRRLHHLAEPKVKKEFWNEHIQESDLASYPHTSGVYNLMMSGGEHGSQKGRGTEPSVHE
jgi:hypothetical protein